MNIFEGKKVLVAGGGGLLGTNLTKRLMEAGAIVTSTRHSQMKTVASSHDRGREYRLYCDLTMSEHCKRAVEGQDYVFMCAAVLSGAGVITKTPLVHVTPNVVMNALMIDAAYNAGVKKYCWFGSSTAYAESGDELVKEYEMFLGDPYDQYFFVGWVKRFGEKLCEMYSNRISKPMPCVVLRVTNIYGPFDKFDWEKSHVTPALIRKVIERHDPLEVWGDGSEVRDLIYVDDLIDGIFLAMEKVDKYDPINIGAGKGYSVNEILETICKVENFHPEIVYNKDKPTTIPKRYVDISKAERVLGFRPKTSLEEGIRKTIEWYRRTIK